ncbi:MAG: hypothetical protein H7A37_03575 [Chlamydiales bacterium]|nr:hypothetical protein [Chlamydiia bacterium]MCP5507367.1 hypothetical protein [Chlamydiales bacterium]
MSFTVVLRSDGNGFRVYSSETIENQDVASFRSCTTLEETLVKLKEVAKDKGVCQSIRWLHENNRSYYDHGIFLRGIHGLIGVSVDYPHSCTVEKMTAFVEQRIAEKNSYLTWACNVVSDLYGRCSLLFW